MLKEMCANTNAIAIAVDDLEKQSKNCSVELFLLLKWSMPARVNSMMNRRIRERGAMLWILSLLLLCLLLLLLPLPMLLLD